MVAAGCAGGALVIDRLRVPAASERLSSGRTVPRAAATAAPVLAVLAARRLALVTACAAVQVVAGTSCSRETQPLAEDLLGRVGREVKLEGARVRLRQGAVGVAAAQPGEREGHCEAGVCAGKSVACPDEPQDGGLPGCREGVQDGEEPAHLRRVLVEAGEPGVAAEHPDVHLAGPAHQGAERPGRHDTRHRERDEGRKPCCKRREACRHLGHAAQDREAHVKPSPGRRRRHWQHGPSRKEVQHRLAVRRGDGEGERGAEPRKRAGGLPAAACVRFRGDLLLDRG
mmetsp:Transcript_2431/g.9568  ORF Transcript_2431/g.9568 Transcript_2431/m.9568 type:complete len:285 (+) Transcript_2431:3594-4448(+)